MALSNNYSDWPVLPENLPQKPPASSEVHVIFARLDKINLPESWLAPEEKTRAARFIFDVHRQRFKAARGLLRLLLGRYLQIRPESIEFSYGSKGKPELATNPHRLYFNLAHSENLALYGFTSQHQIGLDLEVLRPVSDASAIASRFFAPREAETLAAVSSPEREAAFFRCWTAKEAYVKAVGSGLARALDSFEVSFAPGQPLALNFPGDEIETQRWSIYELQPATGCRATLVVEGDSPQLTCWQWQPTTD